ncbi:MAG TPA: TetR/AcrR family transcriptional regulator C-terminal domain-containing protein [Actinomycetales bacterium]|nr:TetR/AcrR family transcriptional regulator C-terminal domain-containing protein [Actinomycetales bacterium]
MPSRSSAPKLNLEVVVETALAVLDKDGLGAVTTRRVAQELGTGPASLYAHVRNKDELLSHVLDKVLADIPLPTARGTWQQRLLRYGRQTRKALLAHPGIAAVAMALPPTGAAAWARQEWLRSLLSGAGLPDDELQAAVDSISLFVIAGAHEEELFAGTDRSSGVAQRLEYGLRLMVQGIEQRIQQHLEHLRQHSQGS